MLPRTLRLSRAGFTRAGRLMRAQSAHFSISYGTSAEAAGTAVVVPKKVAKKSVDRHRLKRQMRAVLLPYSSASRVLIAYAKPGAPLLSYQDLHQELSTLIEGILPTL